jgi:hypothetical protein
MPIYSLYLSTQITSSTVSAFNPIIPINKTNLNNVTWNIDWSNLFKGDEKNYKFCRVRFNLITNSFASAGANWNNLTGYLSCNLGSSFGSTGQGTILGLVSPQDCPTTGSATHVIIVNTMSECGVDINTPTNVNQIFTLSFFNDDAQTLNTSFGYDYEIFLSFDLYN